MKEISFIKDKRKYLHGVVLAFAALAAGLFVFRKEQDKFVLHI